MEQVNQNRRGMTDRAGVFILIALMGAGFVVGGGLSILAWKLMTGQSGMGMATSMTNPVFVNEIRITQMLLAFFIFFAPALLAAFILNRKPFAYLGFSNKNSLKTILLGIAVMAATVVLSDSLATINEMIPVSEKMRIYFKGLEDTYMKQVLVLSHMSGIPDLLFSLLVMALAPAIFEEVFFRGGLQQMMTKATGKAVVSIVVTSLIFSAIHFSFYGFLSRFALSIVLGILFVESKNIWVPILAHFLNNAVAVIQIYILKMQGKSIEDSLDDKFPLWIFLFAMPAVFYLFSLFKKSAVRDSQSSSATTTKEYIS